MQDDEIEDPLRPVSEIMEPDARQRNMLGTLEDIHTELSAINLHEDVPLKVRQLFETAKNVSLYSWFVYRFHQVAEIVGYSALEMALKIRLEIEGLQAERLGLARLLRIAQQQGWITNAGFSDAEQRAHSLARSKRIFAAIAQLEEECGSISIDDPSPEEVEAVLHEIDLVEPFVKYTPKLRNDLAHGSSMLMPTSIPTLRTLADSINQIFPREPASTE